jgi:SRSO17 transposase
MNRTIKARWIREQAHQLKEELGLDHIEGRSCRWRVARR